jgi:hypothetical protein
MKVEIRNGNFLENQMYKFLLFNLSAGDLNSDMPITKAPEVVIPRSFSCH